MNPIVVIATHQRMQITAMNIRLLHPYIVVVVATDINEAEWYRDYENAEVVLAPNEPLGAKWQAGVDHARKIPHSHIIITGSDDILDKTFIERAKTSGKDFIGLRRWYVWHKATDTLWLFDYLAAGDLPLGGGRCYSKALLESCNYQIFDVTRAKLLDDKGFEIVKKFGNYSLLMEPLILAVKGPWDAMNPFHKHLKSPNVGRLSAWMGEDAKPILKEHFNYEI